ncbi:sufE-like protein 2, chloroplastic [Impatiens glandulifera]|uniref:sufE-like protein 2, chloroplastic n=1 Tax=Impatiens glandulifera TaxID=253017 RepID=UPI001FB0B0A3|nr:sufE-like protein 2, chloroplastic [Impatiens glandulifera]
MNTVDKIPPSSVFRAMDNTAIGMVTAFSSSSPPFFSKHWNPIHSSPSIVKSRSAIRFQNPIPRNEFASSSPCSSLCFAIKKSTFTVDFPTSTLRRLISEFESLSEPIDRVKRLLHYANLLQPSDDSLKTESNRVNGCTARVWVDVKLDEDGKMMFCADSDSEIAKGFCSCLISVLDGMTPEEVMRIELEDLRGLNIVGLHGNSSSRVNTWHNVLVTMKKKTRSIIEIKNGFSSSSLSVSVLP